MITRRDLRRIPQLNKLIERKKEHLLFLEEKATSIPSTMPDHERVQTSPSGSGNRYIEAAIDLSKEIAEIEKELDTLKDGANEFISSLPRDTNKQHIAVRTLRYRYIDCLCWNEIADLVGYDACYLQHIASETASTLP